MENGCLCSATKRPSKLQRRTGLEAKIGVAWTPSSTPVGHLCYPSLPPKLSLRTRHYHAPLLQFSLLN